MESKNKPHTIIYKESLAQSIVSDIATFGMIALCGWFTKDSPWWAFITSLAFLFAMITRVSEWTNSSSVLRFYSLQELKDWANKQEQDGGADK